MWLGRGKGNLNCLDDGTYSRERGYKYVYSKNGSRLPKNGKEN